MKKEQLKFSKDISGEETSSKVPTTIPRAFHAETTEKYNLKMTQCG